MAFKMKAGKQGPFKKNFKIFGRTRTTTKNQTTDEDGNPIIQKDVIVKDKYGNIIKKKVKKTRKHGANTKVKVKAAKKWWQKDTKKTTVDGKTRKEKKHVFKPYSDERKNFQQTGELPADEYMP